MWETSRARGALIAFLMVLAVFLANGVITFFNLRRINQNVILVDHSHQILALVRTLRIRMVDAETGMRGYVITSDDAFLEPYRNALTSLQETRQQLDQLLAQSPEQRELLATFDKQSELSLAHMRKAIELRRGADPQAAAALIRTGVGRVRMDAIRTTLRSMEAYERTLLTTRNTESTRAYRTALTTGILTCAFGMALTGLAHYWIVREMEKREQATENLKQANDFLEHRVAERTTEITKANALMRSEIEERRRAEERVQLFAEELQRSNRELEQFASVASHDLQEPLRKIQAFGDRLSERFRKELGEQGQDYIDRMLASAKRMRTLIDDLLEYSRVSTKAQPFAVLDLNGVVADVVTDLEARLQQSGGRVEVGPLPIVRGSPLQMRQLFQNLISNALKFHRPDVPPLVRISADIMPAAEGTNGVAGLQGRIIVADNGIGFEPQYGERIFDLFQRLHGRDEYEGTGIGLAICRKIVERHNGQITAESTPGEGARFLVAIPVEPPAEEPLA
jgi:signal transduction histidine kinase